MRRLNRSLSVGGVILSAAERHRQAPENALNGVLVTAITESGEEVLVGKTFGGIVRLNKQDLREKRARVLLSCAQPFFQCVALRIADQRLYEFDEYYVDLPRVVLR